jgi:hypothetical protein
MGGNTAPGAALVEGEVGCAKAVAAVSANQSNAAKTILMGLLFTTVAVLIKWSAGISL